MHSATTVRRQVEAALETRIPSALTPRPRTVREYFPTGIDEVDALLEGGLPLGAITELVGPPSSGRTTLAQAVLASLTSLGKAVAWIDVADALDPVSAAAAGVDLSQQLWVRCGGGSTPQSVVSATAGASGAAALLMEGSHTPAQSGGCGSPHPRSEVRGLGPAVEAIFQPPMAAAMPASRGGEGRNPNPDRIQLRREWIGTPGAPNLKLPPAASAKPPGKPGGSHRAFDREEQIATDRLPPRRGTNFKLPDRGPKNISAAQIAYTGMVAGAWNDNRNNHAGRGLKTSPEAIAAGLPRFRQLETYAEASRTPKPAPSWNSSYPEPSSANPSSAPETSQAVPGGGAFRPAYAAASPNMPGQPEPSLAGAPPLHLGRSASPVWKALDQALRVTDLLLAAGGFSAIVLDLGSTSPEFAWRVPLATWFRFRAGAERSRAVLLVLTQHPCTRSSAELVLSLAAAEPEAAGTVLTATGFHITVERQRFEAPQSPSTPASSQLSDEPTPDRLHLVPRKPPRRERSARWRRETSWTHPMSPTKPPSPATS